MAPLTYVKLLVYGDCLRDAAPALSSFLLPVPSSLDCPCVTVHFNNDQRAIRLITKQIIEMTVIRKSELNEIIID